MSKELWIAENLKPNELYAGIILGKDGAPDHHLILLPGKADDVNFKKAGDWAKSIGGELPTRREQSLMLQFPVREHIPASSFIDFGGGKWQPIIKPGRAAATLARISEGRKVHGERFISSYYGNERGGRSLARPVGTITTRDRHAIIDGDRMRMFSAQECRAAMGFPADYKLPAQHRLAVHMLGNAVVPKVACDVIQAIARAA